MSRLRLHSYWRSTASYRVRIALNLKRAPYELVTHDLRKGEQAAADYLNIGPQGLVPALDTGRGTIIQSQAILDWLEETWPDPAILPADPNDRAIVRSMAALIACDIHPLNNLRVLSALRETFGANEPLVEAWIANWITRGFQALETLIVRHGGGFAFGDRPSMADCFLVPQVYSARRFKVDLAAFPALSAAADEASKLWPFEAAHPDRQPDAD